MRTFSITDVGMVRQVNQDYVFVTEEDHLVSFGICLWWQTEWADIRQATMLPSIPWKYCSVSWRKARAKISRESL